MNLLDNSRSARFRFTTLSQNIKIIMVIPRFVYTRNIPMRMCVGIRMERNEVPLNIGGYKYDKRTKTYPVFINYHKSEDIQDTIKYEDRFVSPTILKSYFKK